MKLCLPLLCVGLLAMFVTVESLGFGTAAAGSYFHLFKAVYKRLEKVEKRGCVVGHTLAQICDDVTDNDPLCIFDFLFTGELIKVDVPIKFNTPFHETPVVTAGLAGFYAVTDKNCSVSVKDVTVNGFNLHLDLGGLLPFRVDMNWIACDAHLPVVPNY